MHQDLLLGIDFGTGGCKLTLLDAAGALQAVRSREYPTLHPRPGWAEQDPAAWWGALRALLQELDPSLRARVRALALDSYTHGAVLLDEDLRVIRPTIVWTDQRSAAECAWLRERHFDLVYGTACQAPAPTWTLPQLLWLRQAEPEQFARIRRISFVKDYVRFLLTGELACDVIEAQGSMLWDLRAGIWSHALCALAEVAPEWLPRTGAPTDPAGRISARAAAETGLPQGALVLFGASDSAIEAYAAGAIRPGQCVLKLATAGTVSVMTDAPRPSPRTLTYSHIVPGLWYSVAATNAAAVCLRWFRDQCCDAEQREAAVQGGSAYDRIEHLAEASPPGARGVFFHPYLMGERSPYWDPDLRGSFTGLSLSTTRGDLARAILEGVAYSLRDCLRSLEELGFPAGRGILVGGGARSPLWSRIVCDVFNLPLACPAAGDASFGSALLAGVGAGVFNSLEDAVRQALRIEREYAPDPERAALHNRGFAQYRHIHDALAAAREDAPSPPSAATTLPRSPHA